MRRFPFASGGQRRQSDLEVPGGAAMAGHIESEFEAGPDAEFVEGGAQVVLDHLFAGGEDAGDIPVGQTLPFPEFYYYFQYVTKDLSLIGSQFM